MRVGREDLLMAIESFRIVLDDEVIYVKKGDLVRAGHPLLKRRADLFKPAEGYVRFDVEQATVAPGEKR
jgi:hypothetical protein